MKRIYNMKPGANGHRFLLTTNTHADPRVRYRVMRNGIATPYFLSVPYSMMVYVGYTKATIGSCTIELGQYTLRLNHTQKTVEGFMPESWFVDLSEDVEELAAA